jgi:hypothetical protein
MREGRPAAYDGGFDECPRAVTDHGDRIPRGEFHLLDAVGSGPG